METITKILKGLNYIMFALFVGFFLYQLPAIFNYIVNLKADGSDMIVIMSFIAFGVLVFFFQNKMKADNPEKFKRAEEIAGLFSVFPKFKKKNK